MRKRVKNGIIKEAYGGNKHGNDKSTQSKKRPIYSIYYRGTGTIESSGKETGELY